MKQINQKGLDGGYLKILRKDLEVSREGLKGLEDIYFGKSEPNPNLSKSTLKYQELLKLSFLRHFYIDLGGVRPLVNRGIGLNKRLYEVGSAFIANRSALVCDVKADSLKNLYDFSQELNLTNAKTEKIKQKLEKKYLIFSNLNKRPNQTKKILTIDISGAKLADLAGEADVLMNTICKELLAGSLEFRDSKNNLQNESFTVYRYGGDEFCFLLKTEKPENLKTFEKNIWELVVEKRIKKIQTIYARPDAQNNLTLNKGEVRIKKNKFIDDSRPLVIAGDEESQVKALVYDLLLCHINIIPDKANIDKVYKLVLKCNGDTILEKFKEYFKSQWGSILERETCLPDFSNKILNEKGELVFEISNEELLKYCDDLAVRFPGISILFSLAKKTDKFYEADLNITNPEWLHLRELTSVLLRYLFDPVLGTMAYSKHSFDELIKAKQLYGLALFKEVIKNINDQFGLAKGDEAIRQFFDFLMSKVSVNLLKYIVIGRGNADIIFGFSAQAIKKLSYRDRIQVMNSIKDFFFDLKKINTFKCKIEDHEGLIDFNMNVGIGFSKLDKKTGHLKPPDFEQCFKLTEVDFDLKYVSYILNNNPKKICTDLLKLNDISVNVYENPDFWNLYKYLNDPKRGVNNINRMVRNLESHTFKLLKTNFSIFFGSHIYLIIQTLEKLKEKVELQSKITNLQQQISESSTSNNSVDFSHSSSGREDFKVTQAVLAQYISQFESQYTNNE